MRLAFCALSTMLLLTGACDIGQAEKPNEAAIPTALSDYVARPEPAFSWKLRGRQQSDAGTFYDVDLVSQQWQDITWRHVLHIYEPTQLRHRNHVLLHVTGGSNGRRPGGKTIAGGFQLARTCGARVAVLYQVPNQPLMGGRREDDLITETFLRYLETGDKTWPLLFPMVKSAVKSMDAIGALAEKEWNDPLEGFVITGGSKRGWTSWLTPVVDKRVIATAPVVIDILNFQAQMRHQRNTWGKYSEQIIDYTSKGLVKEAADETPRDTELRRMMDPYTYRKQLKLPKLLINGANDPYWVVDAMKWYWDDLVGPRYALFVPNAGHGQAGRRSMAVKTLAAFFDHVVTDTPMPAINGEHSNTEQGELQLKIQSTGKPISGRVWFAVADRKDFRESLWQSQPMERVGDAFISRLAKPELGHIALFGELRYKIEGREFFLSTLVRTE